jgi:hypothetical protein
MVELPSRIGPCPSEEIGHDQKAWGFKPDLKPDAEQVTHRLRQLEAQLDGARTRPACPG